MKAFLGILIFSAVETATVVVWAAVLDLGASLPSETKLLATGVLFVGYVIEHIIAFNVGKGRPIFSWPQA